MFYFPEEIYMMAHLEYIEMSGKSPEEMYRYCVKNQDFFVEVAFAYVEGTPYPKMKESA